VRRQRNVSLFLNLLLLAIIIATSISYNEELSLTSTLTDERESLEALLVLAYGVGNATAEALRETVQGDLQRYEAGMEVQRVEVDRAHVEEADYNERTEEWEVQSALVSFVGRTSGQELEEERIIPECLEYDGCWARFEACREFPQELALTAECLEHHFAQTEAIRSMINLYLAAPDFDIRDPATGSAFIQATAQNTVLYQDMVARFFTDEMHVGGEGWTDAETKYNPAIHVPLKKWLYD